MSGDNDLLERAVHALRETPSPTDQELAEGKAVLLWAQRAAQKKKRSRTLRWVLPLAAMLTAGSALAATEQIERVARAVVELLTPTSEKPARTPHRVAPASPPRRDQAQSAPPPAEPAPEPVAPMPERVARDASATPRSGGARRTAPAPDLAPRAPALEEAERDDASPPAPPSDADLARYREAHHAHFRARDFAAALAAWDIYLHEFPQGTFVIEARYNRAICLVRLGRTDQARFALLPFARGEIGRGYRQAEAKKLLEALD